MSLSAFITTITGFLRAHWKVLFLISILIWLPKAAYVWLIRFDVLPNIYAEIQGLPGDLPNLQNDGPVAVLIHTHQISAMGRIANTIFFGVFNAAGISAVMAIAIAWANSQHLTIQALLRRTLQGTLPVWLYLIVSGLLLEIGTVLLIIPGLYMTVIWYVAAFAAADDRLWPIQAMQRSFRLTRGSRWLLLSLIIGAFVISMIVGVLMAPLVLMLSEAGFEPADAAMIHSGIRAIWSFAYSYIGMAVVAGIYITLKQAHDGPEPRVIARIFD